jgi:alpha-amylase/alpha-mannosidase (GH57 family)
MHQPQYRDPATGSYLLPWTRLHALKDYWGMVKILEEFPGVHMTFNFVPLLAEQIEEYAGGNFKEQWFETVFAPAASLSPGQKRETLERAFQVSDLLVQRWTRFAELRSHSNSAGTEACLAFFTPQDWRDLQVLSQLAWMDEEYLANDNTVAELSRKGKNFSEADKAALRKKQQELLADVLPVYRKAAERGQIEISTTPYYHPILPLLCDSDIARVASPETPLPQPAFRYPQDAREQLSKARKFHERVFGTPPVGLWPSEGSVSDQALEIAAELGFKWFATDEGVLGRTRNIGLWRDASGYPQNGPQLFTPWRYTRGQKEMAAFFRDHYLSDLIGFVYSRMEPSAAAEDLYRRIRAIGDRQPASETATISLILDGENAWEYYPKNGREFLRQFYRRLEKDPEVRPLTATEAVAAAANAPRLEGIFPASWINANFDVWIGHEEDVRAWNLLREARQVYEKAIQRAASAPPNPHVDVARAFEAVLAAEGSDWTWWFGPEHASVNDAEFDELFRKHLKEIYSALSEQAPSALAYPIKGAPTRARREPPAAYLQVRVDGRESNYFEWLGAGLYATEQRSGSMHGRNSVFGDFYYGFGPTQFFLRVDPVRQAVAEIPEFQLRLTLWDSRETRVTLQIEEGKLAGCIVEQSGTCLLHPEAVAAAAYDRILEVGLARELFDLHERKELLLSVAMWKDGLPVDVLPLEGVLKIALGEDNFAWAPE